jgi:hypothetical protein
MDYLDLPLVLQGGEFRRTERETALKRYIACFFASRTYEAHPNLAFGLNLDEHSWLSTDEFLRLQVDEFNRYHRGRMSLMIGGTEARGQETSVKLTLRQGKDTFALKLSLGSLETGEV